MVDNFDLQGRNSLLFHLKKDKGKKTKKKRKQIDSKWSIIDCSVESSVGYKPTVRKYFILHGKYKHTTDNSNDMRVLVNKHRKSRKLQRLCTGQERVKCSN